MLAYYFRIEKMKLNSKNKFHLENDCLLTRTWTWNFNNFKSWHFSRFQVFLCWSSNHEFYPKHLNFNIPSLHDLVVYEEETIIQNCRQRLSPVRHITETSKLAVGFWNKIKNEFESLIIFIFKILFDWKCIKIIIFFKIIF
jgi:hypothetical protein